ncbi:MAG: SpoIVB peptidase S55 domain-containing protein [Myxococcales bacterium]|nr:hypothetical protein [Polyangiaceae bacterium]MDW8248716.1 SpoIVB peptidase S55 domain-containing protein [Myxococcales bacterium]
MHLLKTLPLLPACLLVASAPVVALSPSVNAQGTRVPTLDVDDIKIGAKGYGLTVFQGMKPEKFDVEVVGILRKFRPGQDLILIRTPHERLNIAHTVAGMSGSPIFLDGKMIGAYAYGWQFGAEPIAGVTPIKNMLQDMARPVPPNLLQPIPVPPPSQPGTPRKSGKGFQPVKRASREGGNEFRGDLGEYELQRHAQQIGERLAGSLQAPPGTKLASPSTLLSLGGMGDRMVKAVAEMMTPLGFDVQQGSGGGGGPDANVPMMYENGGAIGIQLIRGDISAQGLGTVTYVEGDKLVAFGHPMMQGGISSMPASISKVHWILASQMRSFKMGEPVKPMGAMVNDLQASIVIDTKVTAPTFPVTVDVDGVDGAPKKSWSMEIAHEKFLSPMYLAAAMGNTVESTVSERRDATWEAKTKVYVKGYGSLELHDFGLAIGGTPNTDEFFRSRAVRAVGMILNNPWEYAQIEKVEMKLKLTFARNLYSMRGVRPLEDTVDVGDKLRVQLRLTQFNAVDETRTIEIPVPHEFAGKEFAVSLVPGWMEGPELAPPESLATLLANLPKQSFAPDSLLAVYQLPGTGLAFKGLIAPRLPASMADSLATANDSDAPRALPTVVRIPFPMGKFIEGRDTVRVRVRPSLR